MNKTAFTQRQKEIPGFEVSVFVPPQLVPWPLKLAHWAPGSVQHLLHVLSFMYELSQKTIWEIPQTVPRWFEP
jgi:hypothetical protein